MPSIECLPDQERKDFLNRLKRIEGQARGIQKMIEEGRDCMDVIQQVASTKSALASLSGEMLEAYALHCLRHPDEFPSHDAAVEQAVRAIVRSGR
ncbi:MAG TPA: metal-sensitive transcriptional regulator [Thermomicrobiales bacterium]|nr:metal-sensitive transcriptional regulator [Thermomicrobiales bacterium]